MWKKTPPWFFIYTGVAFFISAALAGVIGLVVSEVPAGDIGVKVVFWISFIVLEIIGINIGDKLEEQKKLPINEHDHEKTVPTCLRCQEIAKSKYQAVKQQSWGIASTGHNCLARCNNTAHIWYRDYAGTLRSVCGHLEAVCIIPGSTSAKKCEECLETFKWAAPSHDC